MSKADMWQIEHRCFEKGYRLVCGVDEAGRGPLAGPVCAAAVILPADIDIPGLDDSKKLSDKKRRELYPIIKEQALAYGIAFADEKEIELKYNATLVTLDEYSKRLERAEKEVTSWKNSYNNARQDVKAANDKVNSYKIKFNNAAITKAEIQKEIIDEVKADIVSLVKGLKGNLSKKAVCDIIGSYEKE